MRNGHFIIIITTEIEGKGSPGMHQRIPCLKNPYSGNGSRRRGRTRRRRRRRLNVNYRRADVIPAALLALRCTALVLGA